MAGNNNNNNNNNNNKDIYRGRPQSLSTFHEGPLKEVVVNRALSDNVRRQQMLDNRLYLSNLKILSQFRLSQYEVEGLINEMRHSFECT